MLGPVKIKVIHIRKKNRDPYRVTDSIYGTTHQTQLKFNGQRTRANEIRFTKKSFIALRR